VNMHLFFSKSYNYCKPQVVLIGLGTFSKHV
jgi:hypothetical protein